MRNAIIITFFILNSIVHGQTKFTFTEKGLSPESAIMLVENLSEDELQNKTITWIKTNYKNSNTEIDAHVILLNGIKENAILAEKHYFHLQYTIKISFKSGAYTFEPLSIQTKANSKYDMGWKDIDLKNGSEFFKKGKPIKKTKSYVKVIPEVLNDLNTNLNDFLISE